MDKPGGITVRRTMRESGPTTKIFLPSNVICSTLNSMVNSVLFLIWVLVCLSFVLAAFRFGKCWLFGIVVANAILANIFVVKGMMLFGLAATGGNAVYASIFLATDIMAEHYGQKTARRAVFLGFFASVFFMVGSQFLLSFEPADYDISHAAFSTIFSLTPRIVIASMIAYLISQNLDISLFHAIKRLTGDRYLWLRNNGSTIASQFVDTAIFTLIAFWGVYPHLLEMIIFTWLVKVIVAACDTPFMYLAAYFKPDDLD